MAEHHDPVDDTNPGGAGANWVAATKQVATKSALTPLQWGMGISGLFCAPIAIFAPAPMSYLAFALFALLALGFLGLFAYAFLFKAELVQSEDYRLETRRIDVSLLGDDRHKADMKTINAEPVANNAPVSAINRSAIR